MFHAWKLLINGGFCFDRSNTGKTTKELGSVEASIGGEESVPLDLCMNRSGEFLLSKHIKACRHWSFQRNAI